MRAAYGAPKSSLPLLSNGNIWRLIPYLSAANAVQSGCDRPPERIGDAMWNFVQDLRFAFRQFRKSPGFVTTAVLSLMLGIGATTAIFSVVYGVLLDPYPYKDNDRMVHVELNDKSGRGPLLMVTGTEYKELRQASTIDDVFLQQNRQQNLTGDQVPISVNVGLYSPNL